MKQTDKRQALLWLIHLIGWGIMFGFPFFFASREGNPITFQWYLGYVFVPVAFMLVFYVNYFWWIDRVLSGKTLSVYSIEYLTYQCNLFLSGCLDAFLFSAFYQSCFFRTSGSSQGHGYLP